MDLFNITTTTKLLSKDQVYKVYQLDFNNNPKQVIVFHGKREPVTSLSEIFSEIEVAELKANNAEVKYSNQLIHKDDSIQTIKKKILIEMDTNLVSLHEIYLYSKIKDNLHLLKFYQDFTQNGKLEITTSMFGQLLKNFMSGERAVEAIESIPSKDAYRYEELENYLNVSVDHEIKIPIGQKFSTFRDLVFSANPYDILPSNKRAYQQTTNNSIFTFENHLLLNYGDLIDNNIYICLAGDVFDYAILNGIEDEYMIRLYYPLLEKADVLSKMEYERNKQELIMRNKEFITKDVISTFEKVDMFYDIHRNKTSELEYSKRGITAFDIVLHPEFKVILPLDAIFKNIHSTKYIPFIKYNPGPKRENLYRLYSDKISKTGSKIPYLKKPFIMALSKQVGKINQISMLIQASLDSFPIDIYVDFEQNGNVVVRCELTEPISDEGVLRILLGPVNNIINETNDFLMQTGYKMNIFRTLKDDFVEIMNIKYLCEFSLLKPFSLSDGIGCLTSVFDVIDSNLKKGAILRFKRVENFKKMNAVNAMIAEMYSRTGDLNAIANSLILNYNITKDEALMRFQEFLNQYTRIQGRYVNKAMDVAENPGFPALFRIVTFENKLLFEIDKINKIDYIDIIQLYLDSYLRISQAPNTMGVPIENISSICSRTPVVEADKQFTENVITTAILTSPKLDFNDDSEEEEGEEDGEEDGDDDELAMVPIEDYEYEEDGEDGLMPMEDEEEEEEEESETNGEPETIISPYQAGDNEETNVEGLSTSSPEEGSPDGMAPIGSPDESVSEEGSPDGMEPMSTPGQSVSIEQDNAVRRTGGAKQKLKIDDDTKPSKYFSNKLKRLEPNLILTRKDGQYDAYSRACPVAVNRQPVIITDEEKQRIDETDRGAYGYAIKFGTDPNKPNWYICPRFWCMTTNKPLTKEQVDAGECAGNVHEFTSGKHLDKTGNYVNHNPGFLPEGSHPTSCLPCCFKKEWNSNQLERRRETCNINPADIDYPFGANPPENPVPKKKAAETDSDNPKLYIVGFDKYPIPRDRWGFLPPSIQSFLRIDYADAISKKNTALLKPNKSVFLRYGVEQSQHQSFIGCIADIFGSVNRYKENRRAIPTIEEMRGILIDAITIDMYLKYHNGSLVSIFQPPKRQIDPTILNKHVGSEFYNSLDSTNEQQMDFFEDTVSSFENFLDYLRDEDSFIDHTYLWDAITSSNPALFSGGLNLVIMNIANNDITDNVEVLCPSNSYSDRLYDPRRETVILLKHDDFYEPIYLFEIISDNDVNIVKSMETFSEQIAMPNLKSILKIIENTTGKYCKSQPSMPKVYKMTQNVKSSEILNVLKLQEYTVHSQVMNYRGKIIGFMVSISEESGKSVFIPCFPSNVLPNIKSILMDSVNWVDYETTRDHLTKINNKSGGKIPCRPAFKVVEKDEEGDIGIIVGILTETNQFLQIDPPISNDVEDGLEVFITQGYGENGYYEADKILTTSNNQDSERLSAIKNMSLESQFYSAFRATLRIRLNEPTNRELLKLMVSLLDDKRFLYQTKIKKIIILLKHVLRNSVTFAEMDPEVLSNIKEISTCASKCDTKKYCLIRDNDTCLLTIPLVNLLSGKDNEIVYYARLADEILRYKRVRLFLLEPKKYLSTSNIEYRVEETEVILLQSILESDYFDDLVPFQTNKYVHRMTYDVADPEISQKYDQTIPLNKQTEMGAENINADTFLLECVKETLKSVIGNQDSYWKKVLPANAREVIFNDTNLCTFYAVIDIIQKRLGNPVSVQTIKGVLWRKYAMHMEKHKTKILDVLSLQGKGLMIKRVKTSRVTLQDLISSEEYFLTNLDLWALADFFKLPILLFSQKPLVNLGLTVNWVILGGNRDTDKYYCVRSPSISKKIPEYHLITPSFGLQEIKGFDGMINNLEYIENNLSFESYLSTHAIDFTKEM